ncbi:MAG: helix-turn-helix transcriptional regulator [Acidobacteriota bacterium]|nr:helix-turn-helix transcriptional regulator [Acidobacteriota bacterium]
MQFDKICRRGKQFALIPVQELEKLIYDAEMLADVQAYDTARAAMYQGQDEVIPFEITERRVAGESTIKIWREHRGLTQDELGQASGVSRSMIAAIEAGHKRGSIVTLKKLAAVLGVSLDNLV